MRTRYIVHFFLGFTLVLFQNCAEDVGFQNNTGASEPSATSAGDASNNADQLDTLADTTNDGDSSRQDPVDTGVANPPVDGDSTKPDDDPVVVDNNTPDDDDDDSTDPQDPDDSGADQGPKTYDDIKTLCDNTDLIEDKLVSVSFPATQQCDWNNNGNFEREQAEFRARKEQRQSLGLEPGTIICAASFDFGEQPFRYDDYFVFSFNDAIIASGYSFNYYEDNKRLEENALGLQLYDWDKIANTKMGFPNNEAHKNDPEATQFCGHMQGIPGASIETCSFPKHDSEGKINLELNDAYMQGLMSLGNVEDHVFGLTVFGDNDNKDGLFRSNDKEMDCKHPGMDFTVDMKIISPENAAAVPTSPAAP